MSGDREGRALREAARWYAELQDEAAGPDLWRRFLAWERRPGNAAAFRQIEASLAALDRARAGGVRQPPRRRAAWPVGAGIAAAIFLAAAAGASLLGRAREPVSAPVPATLTYVTGIGEQETVVLDDGSRMLLNTASEVGVSYSGAERRVDLVAGQALFDVRREARPFVVVAGNTQTRAIGTVFDVYLPGDHGLQVTLIEGLVSVSGEGSGGHVLLSPGEQMTVRAGERTISRIDTAQARSWTTGMVPFTDARLADAAAELNRYAPVQLNIDAAIAGERISGSFKAGDQEAFAAALEEFLPVTSERRGDEILIRPRD